MYVSTHSYSLPRGYHFTVDTKARVLEEPNFAIHPESSADASMSHNWGAQ